MYSISKFRMLLANRRGDMENTTNDDIMNGEKLIGQYHTGNTFAPISIVNAYGDHMTITDKGHFCPRCNKGDGITELYAYEGFASIGVIKIKDFARYDYGMDAYPGDYVCPCGEKFTVD